MSIDLRCCGAEELIAGLEPGSVAGVIADPPWTYSHDGEKSANRIYDGLPVSEIARLLAATLPACGTDAYLHVWVTFPLLAEWTDVHRVLGWDYLSGAAWGKTNGLGVGFHFRGDSEILLTYRKGRPKPLVGSKSNLWLAKRGQHSEKPQVALSALVEMSATHGCLILDPFAGESASLARCCARLGRRYVGAEIDPERHARALRRLAGESAAQARMPNQTSMFGAEVMPTPGTEVEPPPGYGYGMGRPPERMTDDEQAAVMRRLREAGE